MDIEESKVCFERPFDCVKIVWEIENYFIETNKKKWSVYSPVFNVRGKQVTKWRLNFRGGRMKDDCFASVYLERSELDTFPHKVRVNWRLSYPCAFNNHYTSEMKFIFNKKSSSGMAIRDFESLESELCFTFSDTLKIQCIMIVYDGENVGCKSLDPGLKALSQDLATAYRLEDQCDVTMKIYYSEIKAHKALLFSRVKKLRDQIDLGRTEIDHLKKFHEENTRKVVAYLYTANLDYVLRIPSIEIGDIIDELEIKELKSYYKYDELHLRTEVGVQEYCFYWLINDFKANGDSCVTSHILKIMSNLTFRLYLYKEGFNGTSDNMSIFMEKLEGDWPDNFCVEFAAVDPYNFRHFPQMLRWETDNGSKQGLEYFIPKNITESETLVWLDFFKIFCKICFPSSSSSGSILKVKIGVQSYPNFYPDYHYELLSNDIAYLFETGKFSDFTISCGETEFQVHKFILSARCYKFKASLKGVDFTFAVNIEPEVLRKVICYIYSGRLKKYELPDIFKIYAAAEEICLLPLKYACTDILREYIEAMNVVSILSFADQIKDFKLKFSALKYICKNFDQVVEKLRNSDAYNEDLKKVCFKFMSHYGTLSHEQNFLDDFEILSKKCPLRQVN